MKRRFTIWILALILVGAFGLIGCDKKEETGVEKITQDVGEKAEETTVTVGEKAEETTVTVGEKVEETAAPVVEKVEETTVT
ncbi:MAG: hypothetical protein EHM49_02355, partial [Deltaproteobacteria bacterium]